jgi:hypothetical protein
MQKTILIFFIIINSFFVFGQDTILANRTFFGLSSHPTKVMVVDSLKELPTRIQFIINQLLDTAMTDFKQNIKFSHGQIIDLDYWARKDSIFFPMEYRYVVPKYQLYFDLRDTAISVKNYSFELGLDQYGQITCFEWPRENYNKRNKFVKGSRILKEAIKYAKAHKYKTQDFIYEFRYNNELEKMCWEISFLQKSVGNQYNFSKDYVTLLFDATSLTFLQEYGTSVSASN